MINLIHKRETITFKTCYIILELILTNIIIQWYLIDFIQDFSYILANNLFIIQYTQGIGFYTLVELEYMPSYNFDHS